MIISSDAGDTARVDYLNSNSNINDDNYAVVSCRTLHAGSIPNNSLSLPSSLLHLGYSIGSCNLCEMDDTNYSVEMTLRDFQQFLEEGQCWYNPNRSSQIGNNTRQIRRNRSSRTLMFDPCNALGAEVSLGDFLMHNHNNIDIKVHDAIHSEEIQISDNRRSAVMVIMMERRQQPQYQHSEQNQLLFDDEFNSSLEVQPIHTFDDLLPPNLMNASFDMHNDDDDAATVDMNESYSEEPFADDNSIISQEFGGWLHCDENDDDNDPTTILFAPPTIAMLDKSSFNTTTGSTSGNILTDIDPNKNTNSCDEEIGNDLKITAHVNDDHSLDIRENNCMRSTDTVIMSHSADKEDLATRITGAHVKNLFVDCTTDDNDDNLDVIGICQPKYIVVTQNFASLLALQLLALAISHGLRYLSDFSSTNAT